MKIRVRSERKLIPFSILWHSTGQLSNVGEGGRGGGVHSGGVAWGAFFNMYGKEPVAHYTSGKDL